MPDLLDAPPTTTAPTAPAPRVRSAVVSSPEQAALSPSPRPLRVTVEMYHAMIGAGVFDEIEGRRIELLDEELVEMAAAFPPHAVATDLTADALRSCLARGWAVRTEKPISLSRSEPEPDVSVANQGLKFWSSRHPRASDLLLIVEVSDSTLALDRTRKAAIYAAAGISPYWIVNLPERVLEVRTDPEAGVYRTLRTYREGDVVEFTLADRDFSLPVADLLPAESDEATDEAANAESRSSVVPPRPEATAGEDEPRG
ncbi:Uma2 family endonuclease [Alienimonas chondri]|uniref:Putative restriction endonuclease domain-containing protein n=1 Tax=Alienimonas chondri TaxID=2681879 RepID=A0ABX1VHF1_9PLAN|nr:Uma2 family endonuclease [Alienimonas chondri]NNJ27300.1 hypothetical protein [Alienimonas chondri]